MFKKLFTISIVLLFALSVMGFTVSKRYCKGKLVSISISLDHSSCCESSCCCCCEDDIQFYQLDDDFTLSQNLQINPSLINAELIIFNLSNQEPLKEANKEIIHLDHGPPFIDRQFLFYTHQLKLAPPIC